MSSLQYSFFPRFVCSYQSASPLLNRVPVIMRSGVPRPPGNPLMKRQSITAKRPLISSNSSGSLAASSLDSEYDEQGIGREGDLFDNYYHEEDSPVFYQKMSAAKKTSQSPKIMTARGVLTDERSRRLSYILEKKFHRETSWSLYRGFLAWKEDVFKDRPDVFRNISIDFIRLSKIVNASVPDSTMMKVWNDELAAALDTIFNRFAQWRQRLLPPLEVQLRERFRRFVEHAAISRKIDRLTPMALQVLLAISHVGI